MNEDEEGISMLIHLFKDLQPFLTWKHVLHPINRQEPFDQVLLMQRLLQDISHTLFIITGQHQPPRVQMSLW